MRLRQLAGFEALSSRDHGERTRNAGCSRALDPPHVPLLAGPGPGVSSTLTCATLYYITYAGVCDYGQQAQSYISQR